MGIPDAKYFLGYLPILGIFVIIFLFSVCTDLKT